MATTKTSWKEAYRKVFRQYQEEHGGEPAKLREVAAWARRKGLLAPRHTDIDSIIARDLRVSLHDDYFTDEKNRRVRAYHPRREKVLVEGVEVQAVFWDNIQTAKPEHMKVSLQQRRQAIMYDCKQHQTDTEYYNEHNLYQATLQFSYDYEVDLCEQKESADYPDEPPTEDDVFDED